MREHNLKGFGGAQGIWGSAKVRGAQGLWEGKGLRERARVRGRKG